MNKALTSIILTAGSSMESDASVLRFVYWLLEPVMNSLPSIIVIMQLPRIYDCLPADEVEQPGTILRGVCDHETRSIYINPNQSDKERLITGVHEMLHYMFPKHSEAKVERDGVLIGEVLWRMGYRTNAKKKSARVKKVPEFRNN